MSRLDTTILVLASVAVGVMVAVVVAFYTGVYSPIKHDMVDNASFNEKRAVEPENGLGDALRVDNTGRCCYEGLDWVN